MSVGLKGAYWPIVCRSFLIFVCGMAVNELLCGRVWSGGGGWVLLLNVSRDSGSIVAGL